MVEEPRGRPGYARGGRVVVVVAIIDGWGEVWGEGWAGVLRGHVTLKGSQ